LLAQLKEITWCKFVKEKEAYEIFNKIQINHHRPGIEHEDIVQTCPGSPRPFTQILSYLDKMND